MKKQMKGIVLAGNGDETVSAHHHDQQAASSVYDRQMVFYPLNTLVKAGIKDILIIVAPEHAGQFLNLLDPFSKTTASTFISKSNRFPAVSLKPLFLGNRSSRRQRDHDSGDNIFEDIFRAR